MGDRQGDSRFANVLPVLFYEYLALSLTRSLIPLMIIEVPAIFSRAPVTH